MNIKKFICLITLLSLISLNMGFGGSKKTWNYDLKSIKCTSSDPEKMDLGLTIERVSRGVYAISGNVKINFDIVEGDDNKVGAKSFRSSTGAEDDYKVLPFSIPKAHWYNVLNTHYKDVLMDTLKECSDLPVFEDKFEPPLEKKTYTLTKCQFTQDGLPNHLQEGFYKVEIYGAGDIEWSIIVIAEVTPDM